MLLKPLAAAAAAAALLPATASAYIYSMTAPDAAAVGSVVPVTLHTSIYIQNWDDFGIVWGIGREANACTGCVGTEIGWQNLHGPDAPAVPASGTFTLDVQLPTSYPAGTYLLYAGIPHLVGASGVTDFTYLNSTITLS